ncbi:DUF726 domain protein [Aspergillus sclerotialis]|uniref:DUF726 domain protein n=1 Tax=Aspergillus sclerotialis TaxID=2070753 RepID=A0A3A2ZFZ5_9EURO|nr:DUF726 domain protein [Aspergillus sclerotialis]
MLKNLKDLKEKHAPKFGIGSSDESASARDRGQDLTTILDRSQRADLTILIAQITESMRNDIQFNFQTPVAQNNDAPAPQSESEKDNGTSRPDQPSDAGKEQDPSTTEKRQMIQYVVKDKKAAASALSHFDDWRDSVLLRVGEVLNRDEESPEETQGSLDAPPLKQDERSINKLREVYQPVETPLFHLPEAKKLLILHSLLLLMLSLEHYNALSRVLMVYVVSSLGLDLKILNDDEVKVARVLLDAALQFSSNGGEQEQVKKGDSSRKWKVGIASVAGAVLIGVTGGLAAPLVAAGLGTVMGGLGLGATAAAGYLGALAGSGVIVGGLFGAYGGKMTGKMMDKYAREVEDFAFIPIHGSQQQKKQQRPVDEKEAARQDHRLRVTIGITGWVTDEENFVVPWRVIGADSEVFALRWELESLMKLGNAISAMVTSAAWGIASKEILSKTIFAQIMSAVFLPLGLLKVARIADNPFSVAKARSDKAGEVLADALINKVQGERPVNLIGYSLGSRVIYSCLLSLAKREAYGLVESVILMGSPIPSNPGHWRRMRSVVSGRLVNVFSENDSVLALLYRTSSLQLGVAGLQRVENLTSVENVDVSELISGHLRYQFLVGRILKIIGLENVDVREVSREEAALAAQDRRQEEERARNERRTGVEGDEQSARRNLETGEGFDEEGQRLEKQVQEKTQKNVVARRFEDMDLKGSQSAGANRKDPFDSDESSSS